MKNKFVLPILLLSICFANAQDIYDALRFSQNNLNGTARFRAMGGAFGALGGDISSINVNPAGSVISNNNQLMMSLSNFGSVNNSTYMNTNSKETYNTFDINQLGALFVFEDNSRKVNKISFAINYENTNNFDNYFFSRGSNSESVANYFLAYANGVPLSTLGTNNPFVNLNYSQQQAFFGYEGFIINPVDNDPQNTLYESNVPAGMNNQSNFVETFGYNGKVSFNFAGQMDKFSFGVNLNAFFVDFTRTQIFNESNNNASVNGMQAMRFTNSLYTYGSGFSFNLGALYKFDNNLRLGLSYESPNWFRLRDEFQQSLYSIDAINGEVDDRPLDGNLNIFPVYNLNSPARYNASAAYVFKNGLISADYSYRDFSTTNFGPRTDSHFMNVNQQMTNVLGGVNEFRIGAEYKINALSLRGGFRHEQSPFKSGFQIGDLTNYNAGLGYNFGGYRLDLAYAYFTRNTNIPMFDRGFSGAPRMEEINHNVTLTLLFEL